MLGCACVTRRPLPRPRATERSRIDSGFRLVVGYALSETPYGLIVPVDEPTVYGSMGVPRQHPTLGAVNEVRVVDADGHEVADGTTGELELRNPAITPGYFGKTTESAAMRPGGWLRTGDLAVRRPDGHFFFGGVPKRSSDTRARICPRPRSRMRSGPIPRSAPSL